ncbi:MAG: hypothetical protein CMJ49_06030 [Planctomycetaceae bacterium]|nr:hypothetical protein [Planctomycetaceae bacterium]
MNADLKIKQHAQLNEAQRKLADGDADAALDIAAAMLNDDPAHHAARRLQINALLQLHQPAAALDAIDTLHWYTCDTPNAEAVDPAHLIEIHQSRADALIQLDRFTEAIDTLQQLLSLTPADHEARRRLAALHHDTRDHAAAADHLCAILADNPRDHAAAALLAQVHEATGQWEQALQLHDQLDARRAIEHRDAADMARETDPNTAELAHQLHLARLRRRAQRTAEARETYEHLAAYADDPSITREAADVAIEIGDEAGAHAHLHAALARDPNDPHARARLAEQHMRCGRFSDAAPLWWQIHNDHPDDRRAMAGLIVCAIIDRRFGFAQRIHDRYTRLDQPQQRRTTIARMWQVATPGILFDQLIQDEPAAPPLDILDSLLTGAQTTLAHAAAEQPGHADLHYQLGLCQSELGDDQSAADHFDHALSINPAYHAAGRARIEQLIHTGQLDLAATRLQAVRAARPDPAEPFLDLRLLIPILGHDWTRAESLLDDPETDRHLLDDAAGAIDAACQQSRDTVALARWRAMCHDRAIPIKSASPIAA